MSWRAIIEAREADPTRQRCKACGRVDYFDFHVDDAVWLNVVPEELRSRVVCLACFSDLASARGISFEEALWDALHFAGGDALLFRLARRGTTRAPGCG